MQNKPDIAGILLLTALGAILGFALLIAFIFCFVKSFKCYNHSFRKMISIFHIVLYGIGFSYIFYNSYIINLSSFIADNQWIFNILCAVIFVIPAADKLLRRKSDYFLAVLFSLLLEIILGFFLCTMVYLTVA